MQQKLCVSVSIILNLTFLGFQTSLFGSWMDVDVALSNLESCDAYQVVDEYERAVS
jgi:hypothetical protein